MSKALSAKAAARKAKREEGKIKSREFQFEATWDQVCASIGCPEDEPSRGFDQDVVTVTFLIDSNGIVRARFSSQEHCQVQNLEAQGNPNMTNEQVFALVGQNMADILADQEAEKYFKFCGNYGDINVWVENVKVNKFKNVRN